MPKRWVPTALLTMVLLIAAAGLTYELVIAAVASYLLGDSVRQFSLIIGLYLSALGLGAYLSRSIETGLERTFVDVELGAALVGGLSAPGLFLAFSYTASFRLVLYVTVVTVGALVGLELPILMRILKREFEFKELIAKALSVDYAGALLGSLAFSLYLVPHLGLVDTSILCGLLNASVGLTSTWLLDDETPSSSRSMKRARLRALAVLVLLVATLFGSARITEFAETALYGGHVILAEQSAYQRIVLTEHGAEISLYLNGNLQFSSKDEHRYHEALVHPAMASAARHERILIGGGGDGLAVREVLKWPGVEAVVLVDLDREVTNLGLYHPRVTALNEGALSDPRVTVINRDAMTEFSNLPGQFDVVLLDFPDPSNYSLGKLYSLRFYRTVRDKLAEDGALAVQSTSPLFARHAFWCVVTTLERAGFAVRPYHAFVPSFGDWGYALATKRPTHRPTRLPDARLEYLDREELENLFALPRDVRRVETASNRLNTQALVGYYLDEWGRFN